MSQGSAEPGETVRGEDTVDTLVVRFGGEVARDLVGKDDGDHRGALTTSGKGPVVASAALSEAFAQNADGESGREDDVCLGDGLLAEVGAGGEIAPGEVEVVERDRHDDAGVPEDVRGEGFDVHLGRHRLERGDARRLRDEDTGVFEKRLTLAFSGGEVARFAPCSPPGAKLASALTFRAWRRTGR